MDAGTAEVKLAGDDTRKDFGANGELELKHVEIEWERLGLSRDLGLENITDTVYWDLLNDLIEQARAHYLSSFAVDAASTFTAAD